MSVAGCGFIFQIIAGLMLAVQVNVRFSALGLAVFTLRASLMLLDFWRLTGPAYRTAISAWQTNLELTGTVLSIGFHSTHH